MQISINRCLLLTTLFLTTLLNSCKKEEVISDVTSLGIGSYLTLVKTNNTIIDYSNVNTSTVSITVNEYGSPIEKVKIFVSKGPTSLNRANWKAVKEIPYSGETVLTVKATEIATALGIPPSGLETGATYTLYNQVVTKSGKTFDIVNTNNEFAGNGNYKMALTWAAVVVCPFVSTGFAGDFEVVVDEWADYSPGDVIKVNAGANANQLVFPSIFLTNPARPVVLNIDPATGAATVASQDYGDYPQFGISNIKARTVGTNNYVFSCVGSINIRLNHTTAGGTNYGDYTLRLKKK